MSLTKLNRKSTVRWFDKRVTRYAVSVHIKAVYTDLVLPAFRRTKHYRRS